ncbi:tetratricopeptide repeat protein, partial [Nonomuraea sp. KM90]|uniref:tetratricopeptide repeat protein n=1 Tax=Nonomuraea sp. KM90 TaxID=3457428 RepID=UPI003FCD6AA3
LIYRRLHVCLRPSTTSPDRPETSPLASRPSPNRPNYFSEITSLSIYQETGDRRHEADTLSNIGSTYLGMDLNAEALIHFQKALAIARDIRDPYESSRALLRIGDSQRLSGQFASARETCEQALALSRQLGDPFLEASSLLGLGEALLCMHGRRVAARPWRQALTIFERLSAPEAGVLRQRLEALEAAGA